jgi:hypothetical protein
LSVTADSDVVFVFDTEPVLQVTVHDSLGSVRGLVESLDVAAGSQVAFTAEGRVVLLLPSDDVFAEARLTEEVDVERLRALLRQVRGPAHLADDPAAYAREWRRLDHLDSGRPPFVPQRLWSWCSTRLRAREAEIHASADRGRRLRIQHLDTKGARVRVAFLAEPGQAWKSEVVSAGELSPYLALAHTEDAREWGELFLQARAARREWGHEGGFAEWTPRHGARRFPGDIFRAVDD